jgi:hypothetical protein
MLVAAITSIAIGYKLKPIPYYEKLIRIQAEQELGQIDERIVDEPLEVQALLLDYSNDKDLTLKAWIALSKYPEKTRGIFQLYGAEQEFKDILRIYGDPVIPVISYFLDHDVTSLMAMKATQTVGTAVLNVATEKWNKMAGNQPPPNIPAAKKTLSFNLDASERGWYAVNFIKVEGHTFIGEFVADKNGDAKWIQTQRITNGLASLFTSGVRNLESKYVLDENIMAEDGIAAALDVLPFLASLRLLRLGKSVTTTGRVVSTSRKDLSLMSRTRLFATRLLPRGALFQKFGKYGASIAGVYLLMTHPGLISSLFNEIAELVGVNSIFVQFLGWFLILVIVLYPFSWALKIVARVILWGVLRLEKSRKLVIKRKKGATPLVPRAYIYRPICHNACGMVLRVPARASCAIQPD